MTLADAVRGVLAPALWARGVAWVDAGGARLARRDADEECWLVTVPGGRVPFEVLLWPTERDWTCSCGAVPACAHVAAAGMARERGPAVPSAAIVRVSYTLRRAGQGLLISGVAASEALRRDEDQELSRVLAGWWDKPAVPRGLWERALSILAGCPCTLDGQPITTDGRPVLPRGLVTDQGDGFLVRLVRAPGIDEAFRDGIVRMGTVLRPIGEADLSADLKQRLSVGISFGTGDVERLVTRFLPELRRVLEVEVRTTRLPEVAEVPPRILLDVRLDGTRLRILPRIVYGDPPVARLERGNLVRLAKVVPVRDVAAEATLARRLGETGMAPDVPVEREGAAAAAWTRDQAPWAREQILRASPSLRAEDRAILPRVGVAERADGSFEVNVDAGGVDPTALLAAWRASEGLVPLVGGGWRPLPRDWLDRHGALLAELLSARDGTGRVPRAAAPLLVDVLEGLDVPAPPGLASLRALAGRFDAVPGAELPPDFQAVLRPYQQRGVDWMAWLRSIGMGGILADDMGLGKTVQCLGALRLAGGPSLVVAPTSVLRNWASEAARFVPGMRVNIYHGPSRALDDADLVITSYAILRLDAEILGARRWTTVVLDEAQAIKNPDSQAAAAARSLDADLRFALTGTPIENRLEELWSAFHFVSPGLLGGRQEFRDRFAGPIEGGSRRAQDALRRRIRPFLLRRLKSEVARDLPPRTDMVLRCTLSAEEREVYESVRSLARADVARLLDQHGMMRILEVLLRMRQAASHTGLLPGRTVRGSAKLELLLEQLDEILSEGHKALVFSQWTSLLDLVEPELRARGVGFTRLDGSTRDRAAVVDDFSRPDGPPVFLLSLKAGGTGLNLVAADYVFHLDPWWNPAVEDQATDRAHRIGQDRPVVSCRLIAEDTVEERILELQERKRSLARAALDEEALARGLSREELLALFD